MQGLPWFRMYVDFLEDPKILSLAFEDQRHFIGILALKSAGVIDQACDSKVMNRIVAQKLWIDHSAIDEVKRRLMEAGLIDGDWQPEKGYTRSPATDDLRQSAEVWAKTRKRIFARDDYTCKYCGARGVKLECDHVIPVSRGGSNDDENLTTACRPCNRSKRDKLLEEWL